LRPALKTASQSIKEFIMKRLTSTLIAIFFFAVTAAAQSGQGTVTGKLINEQSQPLVGASVAVYNSSESSVITGSATNSNGVFDINVDPGNYVLEITYLSYQTQNIEVQIDDGETEDLGTLTMKPTSESLGQVYVRAEQSQMEMNFDKRTFSVGQDITSMGGSAVQVLDNVPSIATDIDGNISLRGNESVRVLINGKPSSMVDGSVDALRSIPATMIKEVEIITNPSSKFAAEGSGGIINIILKKERERGLNGSLSAETGLPQEYGGSTNLNYRFGDINLFMNGGVDYESEPESGNSFERFAGPDTSYMYRENSQSTESEIDGDLQLGADFYLSENEVLTFSTYGSIEEEDNVEDITYIDYSFQQGARSGDNVLERTIRDNNTTQNERNLDVNLDYENKIDGDDHKLVADASFDISSEESNTSIQQTIQQGTGTPVQERSVDTEEEMDLRFNAEYVRPLGESWKFEAGLRSDTEWMDSGYSASRLENGTWTSVPRYTQNFLYTENVNAAFAIFGLESGDWSGQVGVRAENTNIRTEIEGTGQVNEQNYLGLFPSVFLNYSFNEQQSVQISYSRRLSRPWSRSLLPSLDFEDSRSQWTGNPNLTPEYSNSYEAGYLHYWETGSLLTSFYYRHRTDVIQDITVIENISTNPQQNIRVRRPINFATEQSWGIELSADQEIANSLSLNGSANLFRSDTEGSYTPQGAQTRIYDSRSENFRARMRLQWEIADGFNYQASVRYRGPNDTPQGTRSGMTMMDTGLAKDFMDGKAKISLNVRDVFNAQNFQNTVLTDGNPSTDYYSRSEYSWSSRSGSLSFQYFFGRDDQQGGGGNRGGRGDY
jgi:outer membrane receptor protein involved in Fe transport